MTRHLNNISFDKENKIFHLKTKGMSYVMQIYKEGYLAHLYWGNEISKYNHSKTIRCADRAFSPNPNAEDRTFSLDTTPLEYPAFGNTDFRTPAFQVEMPDGTHITDFRYSSHEIFTAKPVLSGLPSTYGFGKDVESLVITLKDEIYPLYIDLTYSIFKDFPVLTRSVKVRNEMDSSIKIKKLSSCNVDFRNEDFELIHLTGAWGNERNVTRQSIDQGLFAVQSRRGSSSHHHNPFVALISKGTNEDYGDVYTFNFVYSGNFLSEIEKDSMTNVRVNMGLNPFNFEWIVEPKKDFQSPEVVMSYSSKGLGEFSRNSHMFYRTHLLRGMHKDKLRPILINNWEATYFDFNEEKIMNLIDVSSSVGIELFVLDDGWYGKRNSDTCSLGDWKVNLNKLPNGLDHLIKKAHQKNMMFGVWVEPEMISKDSDLYRNHPEWCLQVEGRRQSESRNQLILDLANPLVCDYVFKSMDELLTNNKIDYIKWDMNRNMTEPYSLTLDKKHKLETSHRYILGLYGILEKLVTKHSNVLFESCSGGGGRFDPGMLYYMPQTWASDNTDAIERLKIQYGTSLAYPTITVGAHVSAVPNHQVDRYTDLKTRGDIAMSGNFGYELDITKENQKALLEISNQVEFYKKYRHIIQFGQLYRIQNGNEDNTQAWQYISLDQKEVLVFFVKKLSIAQENFMHIKLKGLENESVYTNLENKSFYGDELMYSGLDIPELKGDFKTYVEYLKKND